MTDETADGSITITLTKPIPVLAEMKTEIRFRKPTGGDIVRVGGNPVEFDPVSEPPKIQPITPKMFAMMARLSGFPSGSIEFMDTNDVATCAWALAPFFLPMRATDSSTGHLN